MPTVLKVVACSILSGFPIVSGRRIHSILTLPSETDFTGWLLKQNNFKHQIIKYSEVKVLVTKSCPTLRPHDVL